MSGRDLFKGRHALGTLIAGVLAAGSERTAGGRVQRAGDIAGEHDALVGPGDAGIGDRKSVV